MPPQTHSHQWVRSILLIVSTLAVVGVLFAIYIQYSQTVSEPTADAGRVFDPPPLPRPTATTAPASPAGPRIGGIPLSEGGKTKINLYPREGTEARLELVVDSFAPTGKSEREMRLVRPVIRFRTPSGQLVRVESDEGVVELNRMRGESYDLARGRLSGHVKVLMDRLTREERAKLPPERQDDLTEDRLIRMELDDLVFDLEYARVESAGRVFASLAEAEFEGRGLLLRYDEAASRVEHLKIAHGDHVTLRRMGGALAIGLPKASPVPEVTTEDAPPAATPPTPKREAETAAAAPSRPRVDEDGVPYFMPDAPEEPRKHETATYEASFEGDVIVDQFEGRNQSGLLIADRLAFFFDFGQRERDQVRPTPGSSSAERAPGSVAGEPLEAAAEGAIGSAAAGSEDRPDESVVLKWKGPLQVDLVRDATKSPAEDEAPRLHITASGREVYVADRRGNARCRKLVHHQETKRLWLEGDDTSPLALDMGDGGQLTGREVFWDGGGNTVSVIGPGRLAEGQEPRAGRVGWTGGGPSGGTSIAFEDEIRLCLGVWAQERVDPVTGDLTREERQVLQSAVLLGNVMMSQGANSIAGDRVEAAFGPPQKEGSFADNLQSLHIEGRVVMVEGDERIMCETMDVALAPDPAGRVAPTRAVAVGQVSARQGPRSIAAQERMVVELHPRRVEKPAFDPVQAKVIALQRGLKVEAIDWGKRREEYESEERYEPALERLQAYGAVRVQDPDQNLAIDAGELNCAFKDGRQIEKGWVIGEGAQPASVTFGDFGIVSQKVDFDATLQWAEVPGAGRLSFLSRKDLDGRAADRPVPTAITWGDRMSFRGRENKAVFSGTVHAVSETSTFDCREMLLDFAEDEAPAGAGRSKGPLQDWWVLRPWTHRAGRPERPRLEAPPIRKELAYLTAKGDVVALNAAYDERDGHLKSRARIAGPQLAVDLRNQTQTLTVDQAGTLLIEDYEQKSARPSEAPSKTSPFGLEGGNLPSQTFLSWQGSMSYYSSGRLAVFEKDVEMSHRSGSKLILAEGVLSESALAQMKESGKGRDARLACRQLNVQFRGKDEDQGAGDRAKASKGLGGMSGNEVASFAATGDVYFEDSGVSVTSRTVTFNRERNLLQILGSKEGPAELIDLRGGKYKSFSGPEIYWDRATDRIEAPGASIRAR